MVTKNLALNNFKRNISSVIDLLSIHKIVVSQLPTLALQAEEILRATIVLSVSALDNFFHDFYRTEIVDSYLGIGNFNVQFDKIKISIKSLNDIDNALSNAEKQNFLSNELRKIQKTESFQSAKSIENIFLNLNVKNIWSKLEQIGIDGFKANDIKRELANIIDRRNKISHESDWDFVNQMKYPIKIDDAQYVLNYITKFVESICKIEQ